MTEEEMQSELAVQRELIAALSGRIDTFEREGLSKSVKNGRMEKRVGVQEFSLSTHARDLVKHSFLEEYADRGILGMDELREDASGGTGETSIDYITVQMAYASDISNATIPYDTVKRNTNAAVFEFVAAQYAVKVLADGDYEIIASCKMADPFYDADGDMVSVPDMFIKINGTAIASAQASETRPGGASSHNAYSPWMVIPYIGQLEADDVITITTTADTQKDDSTPLFMVKKIG